MYGAIIADLMSSTYDFNNQDLITDNSFYSSNTILTIAIIDAYLNGKDFDRYLREYILKYKDYRLNTKPYYKNAFSNSLISWSKKESKETIKKEIVTNVISPIGFLVESEYEAKVFSKLATIPMNNKESVVRETTLISLIIYYARKGLSKKEIFHKLNLNNNDKINEFLNRCLSLINNSNSFEDVLCNSLQTSNNPNTIFLLGALSEPFYEIDDELKDKALKHLPDEYVKVLRKVRC